MDITLNLSPFAPFYNNSKQQLAYRSNWTDWFSYFIYSKWKVDNGLSYIIGDCISGVVCWLAAGCQHRTSGLVNFQHNASAVTQQQWIQQESCTWLTTDEEILQKLDVFLTAQFKKAKFKRNTNNVSHMLIWSQCPATINYHPPQMFSFLFLDLPVCLHHSRGRRKVRTCGIGHVTSI